MACSWQTESNGCIVGERVAWVELIRHCVGETVVASLVALEAGCLKDWLVSDEACVGLNDKRISVLVIGPAVRV